MPRVVVKTDRCKACGFCIAFCPKKLLVMSNDLNIRGVHYACLIDEKKCTSCGICGLVCPDVAVEVYR